MASKGLNTAVPGELAVALNHIDLVLSHLKRLERLGLVGPGTRPDKDRHNATLGMGIIEVELMLDPVSAPPDSQPDLESALDEIVRMIRLSCSDKYRGWVPTMGKNRVLNGIAGDTRYLAGGGGYGSGGGGYGSGGGGGLPWVPQAGPTAPSVEQHRGADARIALLDTPFWEQQRSDIERIRKVDYDGAYLPDIPVRPFESGHATFILGLIEQRAPGAAIAVRPVLDEFANATAWDVACAMVRLLGSNERVDIANVSLGCYTRDNQPPLLLQRAVQLLSPSVLIVAAAGNHNHPSYPRPFWPAALDDVVSVGARDEDELASFSPQSPWVNVTAPGVHVTSRYLNGEVQLPNRKVTFPGYATWRGTSFAAATVTGEISGRIEGGTSASKALHDILHEADGTSLVQRYRP